MYSLRRPNADGRTELLPTPIEPLGLLAQLVTFPWLHKHRHCGVLAPHAALRKLATASAVPAGATPRFLDQVRTGTGRPVAAPAEPAPPSPVEMDWRAARCRAMPLTRAYECLPLRCPQCGEPRRIIAVVVDRRTVERILAHVGRPTQSPELPPACSPPQHEFGFDQTPSRDDGPGKGQATGRKSDDWE